MTTSSHNTNNPQTVPQLLDTASFRSSLEKDLSSSCRSLTMAAAYLTKAGFSWFAGFVSNKTSVCMIVRWRLHDLLSGASDLETFQLAAERGWEFRVNQQLHAKLWLFDNLALFVGSTNPTARGLGLRDNHNIEFGVRVIPKQHDMAIVDELVRESILVNAELFESMSAYVAQLKSTGAAADSSIDWPSEIQLALSPPHPMTSIWVSECFHTDGGWLKNRNLGASIENDEAEHDLSLLGISHSMLNAPHINRILQDLFMSSRMCKWLVKALQETEKGEMYFGELSAALHNALADDPKPYRKDVKGLLTNLLSWLEILEIQAIRVDRPNYSQRVFLIQNSD